MKYRGQYDRGVRVVNALHLTVATNASGDGTWTFPVAFPNTLLGYQVTECSDPAALGAVVVKGRQTSDRTKVVFRAYASSTGAALGSTSVTVNITAWGC